jgi:hypothetical protein
MNEKQRAVIQNWLEMCRSGHIKIADHELTDMECDVLVHAIQAIAGDLEVASGN